MFNTDILDYIASGSILLGNIWQISYMVKTKETKGLSWGMLILLTIANLCYMFSGAIMKVFSLWLPDVILLILTVVQIGLKFYYEYFTINEEAPILDEGIRYRRRSLVLDNRQLLHPRSYSDTVSLIREEEDILV